ncbi:hypothetical protein Dsin_027819 [Dipteronia sinensis]|uniref:Protein kinase domain-containing protein n=1 Tax=Dipteronia sinensis TaxID=43782 RepID=A0AAE0DTN2_9ROSI|nr:hypothetical protein Dsin_027819 [Dipteronia sinensis]
MSSTSYFRFADGKDRGKDIVSKLYLPVRIVPFLQRKLDAVTTPTSPSPVTRPKGKSGISSSIIIAIIAPITAAAVLFVAGYCFLIRRARRKKYNSVPDEIAAGNDITTIESLQYDFGTIQAATNGFSTDNKLGEGGFGEVYKGVLSSAQEIAVKRLSSSSGQGSEEFKNEVVLVAKLQHRNLVKLLGFCLEGEERYSSTNLCPTKALPTSYLTQKSKDNWIGLEDTR